MEEKKEELEQLVKPVKPEYRIFNESMSEEVNELFGALAKAQGACANGTKDKDGYGYKYMTLDNLTDIIRKPFTDNGLCIIQTHELTRQGNGSVVTHTTIGHSSGQWMKSSFEMPIVQMKGLTAPQMIGVVATYARRYSLQSLALVASEEDTDGK